MLVYIISKNGRPLMPCAPVVARLLLKEGKAIVKKRLPFTLKLITNSTEYTQAVTAGMDTGSKIIGSAAIANGKVLYQAEISLRNDVSKKLTRRAMYRRTRRSRKTRYRPARWLNRAASKKDGRLAPSLLSKIASHLREKKQVEAFLPVSKWKVETASFDIHKITNPDVQSDAYQKGDQKGYYNVKAYVLHRDNYQCQAKRSIKHHPILNVHHLIFRSEGGTNSPTGKLFGLRKHDLIKTQKGMGFIKGKRSSGYFALGDIHGKTLHASASVKKNTRRLIARSTTLTYGVALSSSC